MGTIESLMKAGSEADKVVKQSRKLKKRFG